MEDTSDCSSPLLSSPSSSSRSSLPESSCCFRGTASSLDDSAAITKFFSKKPFSVTFFSIRPLFMRFDSASVGFALKARFSKHWVAFIMARAGFMSRPLELKVAVKPTPGIMLNVTGSWKV